MYIYIKDTYMCMCICRYVCMHIKYVLSKPADRNVTEPGVEPTSPG